jgi:hypothetical protein
MKTSLKAFPKVHGVHMRMRPPFEMMFQGIYSVLDSVDKES